MEKRFFIKLDHLKPYNSIILNTIFIWLILFYHFCISSQLIQLFYANSIDIMFISRFFTIEGAFISIIAVLLFNTNYFAELQILPVKEFTFNTLPC